MEEYHSVICVLKGKLSCLAMVCVDQPAEEEAASGRVGQHSRLLVVAAGQPPSLGHGTLTQPSLQQSVVVKD